MLFSNVSLLSLKVSNDYKQYLRIFKCIHYFMILDVIEALKQKQSELTIELSHMKS